MRVVVVFASKQNIGWRYKKILWNENRVPTTTCFRVLRLATREEWEVCRRDLIDDMRKEKPLPPDCFFYEIEVLD